MTLPPQNCIHKVRTQCRNSLVSAAYFAALACHRSNTWAGLSSSHGKFLHPQHVLVRSFRALWPMRCRLFWARIHQLHFYFPYSIIFPPAFSTHSWFYAPLSYHTGSLWQGFGGWEGREGAAGVSSMRRCQKLSPCQSHFHWLQDEPHHRPKLHPSAVLAVPLC